MVSGCLVSGDHHVVLDLNEPLTLTVWFEDGDWQRPLIGWWHVPKDRSLSRRAVAAGRAAVMQFNCGT